MDWSGFTVEEPLCALSSRECHDSVIMEAAKRISPLHMVHVGIPISHKHTTEGGKGMRVSWIIHSYPNPRHGPINFLEAEPCSLVLLSYDKKFCATARKEGIAAANGGKLDSAKLVEAMKSAGRWPV